MTRLQLGLCFCFTLFNIGQCFLFEPAILIQSANGGFRNLVRAKRDINVTHLSDPNDCLLKCNNVLLDNLWEHAAENQTASDANCKAQLQAFDCFHKCPSSQLRDLLNVSGEMTTVMCSDAGKKYVSSYNCLQQLFSPINTTCDDMCKEFGNSSLNIISSIHYYDFGTIAYETDGSIVTKKITDVCKLFQCKQKCSVPAINAKCGKDIADTSSKVTKATLNQCVSSYKILNVMTESPSECKVIV